VAVSRRRRAGLLCLLLSCIPLAEARLKLTDADGTTVAMAGPAQRIVVLAPHLTDSLVALGARKQIVGVVDDHEQRGAHARSLSGFPVVADAGSINYERMVALQPDLVLAWGDGTPRAWVAQLRRQGLAVAVLRARTLDDMAGEVELLGRLSGHDAAASRQAQAIRAQIAALTQDFARTPRLRYFHQVWRQPLYTLSGDHLLSQALARCGADNIVPPGPVAAPLVSPELVLRENPDLILFSAEDAGASRRWWERFSALTAVRRAQWLVLADRRLTRPGPGMLSAIRPVCAQIAIWRKRTDVKQR
jgi:iron complex transport system substrate-binding protein